MLAAARDRLTAESVLAAFAAGERIDAPVAVVAAHPDDETLSFGVGLSRLVGPSLIHLTDGAPLDLSDARRAGFETRIAYAEARRAELARALETLGARPGRRLAYLAPDQEACRRLAELTRRLAVDLAVVEAVVSHAYEGGHPDHDAAAFAVQAACALLERRGRRAPIRLEFAGYGLDAHGMLRAGNFHEHSSAPGVSLPLSLRDRDRRRRALDAFVSQRATLATLGFGEERVRLAPTYDFTRPPPAGRCLYDRWGWSLTGQTFRAEAGAALGQLELSRAWA